MVEVVGLRLVFTPTLLGLPTHLLMSFVSIAISISIITSIVLTVILPRVDFLLFYLIFST